MNRKFYLIKIGIYTGILLFFYPWLIETVSSFCIDNGFSYCTDFVAEKFINWFSYIFYGLNFFELFFSFVPKSESLSLEKRIEYLTKENCNLQLKLETSISSNKNIIKLESYNELSAKYCSILSENEDLFEKNKYFQQELQLLKEQHQSYPWLAKQLADLQFILDKEKVNYLLNKPRPALRAAEQVKEIANEKKLILQKCKMYEYQLNYYENTFPWLEEFKDLDPSSAWLLIHDSDSEKHDEYEYSKNWISPSEYQTLPSSEKWQLALDRFIAKKKTNWQIGIEYERYVGYLYEKKGYKVLYSGALLGLEDMGRDLIAKKKNTTLIIQCKRWSLKKIIHEKHIFQLLGSVIAYRVQHKSEEVEGLFITSATLSDLAKECAQALDIEVVENYLIKEYPLIKCNISKTTEKIYHLPFDQQYDTTQINQNDGDFYAWTTQEAEEKGFRHAYKWKSEQ